MGRGVVGPSRNLTFNCIPPHFLRGGGQILRTCFEVNFKSAEQFYTSIPSPYSLLSLLLLLFPFPLFFFYLIFLQVIGAAQAAPAAPLPTPMITCTHFDRQLTYVLVLNSILIDSLYTIQALYVLWLTAWTTSWVLATYPYIDMVDSLYIKCSLATRVNYTL